jgi:ribonuclease P protein subunit RPR2
MKQIDEIARERCAKLLKMACEKLRAGDERLAKRYVDLARRIAMRHRFPLGRSSYCRKCGMPLVQGISLKTRVAKGKRVNSCLKCGATVIVPFKR